MIEAKLKVFKEYEPYLSSGNILIHHDFEECDDICKTSGAQKLLSVHETITSLKNSIPNDISLEKIVKMAADKILSRRYIRDICYEVDLTHDNKRVGTVHSGSYFCYYVGTVKSIKKDLVKETVEKISEDLGSEICKEILEHIKAKVKLSISGDLNKLQINISDDVFATLKIAIVATAFIFFTYPLLGILLALIDIFVSFIMYVDINSESWRKKVADEIFDKVSKQRKSIINNISPIVKTSCKVTTSDLEKLGRQLSDWKQGISPSDHRYCEYP